MIRNLNTVESVMKATKLSECSIARISDQLGLERRFISGGQTTKRFWTADDIAKIQARRRKERVVQ
jgi:hypothetical protein